jgi:hypothetical protein
VWDSVLPPSSAVLYSDVECPEHRSGKLHGVVCQNTEMLTTLFASKYATATSVILFRFFEKTGATITYAGYPKCFDECVLVLHKGFEFIHCAIV